MDWSFNVIKVRNFNRLKIDFNYHVDLLDAKLLFLTFWYEAHQGQGELDQSPNAAKASKVKASKPTATNAKVEATITKAKAMKVDATKA